MDTEKKVQFVALTKEEIDAMIQQAALAGAQVASDAMMVGQRKSEKEKIDRRLHNTDLLLRNYILPIPDKYNRFKSFFQYLSKIKSSIIKP